jgi:ATP-dependent Lon protease
MSKKQENKLKSETKNNIDTNIISTNQENVFNDKHLKIKDKTKDLVTSINILEQQILTVHSPLLFQPEKEYSIDNLDYESAKITSVNNESNDSIINNTQYFYHLAYLTPEEIFLKFIVPASSDEANHFFTQLCQAHHFIEDDIFLAKNLFSFILEALKLLIANNAKTYTHLNFEFFLSNLKFTNSVNLFYIFSSALVNPNPKLNNNHFLSEDVILGGINYFSNFLGISDDANSPVISLNENLEVNDSNVEYNVDDVVDDVVNEEEEEEEEEYTRELLLSIEDNGLSIYEIINMHNNIIDKIGEAFKLNEGVKQILLNYQKITSDKEDNTYLIIKNSIFDGEVPANKEVGIQSRLLRSKQILSYAVEEQTMFHNIVQGLITKNESQFLHGVDSYILHYLADEKSSNSLYELSINDMIVLFCTSYFTTIQNANAVLSTVLIDFIFNYYDEKIFDTFMKRYNIPKNLLIRVSFEAAVETEESKKEFFLPFIEFALLNNNYSVADSLINLGFTLEPFNHKIIDDNQVLHYYYKPFEELGLLNENHFLYFIKRNLVSGEQDISYQEFADDKSSFVSNNIFFYFAYKQFNDAFIFLYDKTKKENTKFTTKTFKNYYKTDLLSYYLMFCNKTEAYGFDVKILDILIAEGYTAENNPSGPDLIHVLQEFNTDTLVDAVQYLKGIFPIKHLDKPITQQLETVKSGNQLIQWFDRTKLEAHLKKIEKEKDSANKEYIKHMLLNNAHLKPNLLINDEGFFEDLQTQFPNFEEVIRFYKSQFRLKKLSGKTRITPILLLGEPGIGKTYFAKKLAESLDTGYTFLDMASVTANWVLTGNNGTWKSSKQGKVLESIMKSRTINPIFLMDELEKARSGEFDPTMSLYQLLEEINAKAFTDEFIDFQFDASGIIYIACANTLGNLSEPLKTRFKIINVPKPNAQQILSIIHNIYLDATKDTHIFNDSLDEDIIQILKKETLRSIKVMIDEAVGIALLERDSKEIDQLLLSGNKISLQLKDFQSPHKKKAIGFNNS